ncbi:hypothetical protein ACHAW5_004787 [Stephanodiscus triporus]|uniref:Uncharacterized protein n=1 Tax=Stephanodiscus triporus TaxID=2934178 RepID=A0ABD3N1K3_9STRA
MSTYSFRSSSTSSSRNTNLQAAKSALGLDGSTGSVQRGDPRTGRSVAGEGSESAIAYSRSRSTTTGGSSSRRSTAAPTSHRPVLQTDGSLGSSRPGRSISSRGGDRYSSLHALSDAARSEARSRREGSSVAASIATATDYSAREDKHSLSRSQQRQSLSDGRSWTSSSSMSAVNRARARVGGLTPPPSPPRPPFSTLQTHRHDRLNAAHSRASSAASSLSASGARMGSNNATSNIYDAGTLEVGSELDSLTDMNTLAIDTDCSIVSSIATGAMSNSYYERKKIYHGKGDKGANVKTEAQVGVRGTGMRRKRFGSLTSMQEEDEYYVVDEGSSNSLFNVDSAPSTTNAPLSAQFGEMRSLLMAITPMQLEALMIQLFGDGNDPSNDDSFLTNQGWKHTLEKSHTRKFRKDTCLAEMNLPEIKRYASDKKIRGIDECTSVDEAMDAITLEFERLVSSSVGQRGIFDAGEDDDDHNDGFRQKNHDDDRNNLDSSMHESIVKDNTCSDSSNNGSDYSELAEGRATLQRSLRACTLPELRLIVERLNLDHLDHDTNNKSELILMIENSMLPDMNASPSSGGTTVRLESSKFSDQSSLQRQPQSVTKKKGGGHMMTDEYYRGDNQGVTDDRYYSKNQSDDDSDDDYYDDPYPDQDSDQEESSYRKVKFTRDTKKDKSHLAPKRKKGGSWRSFVTFPDDTNSNDNDEGGLVLRDGVDDDMNEMGDKRRRRYRRFGPPLPTTLRSLRGKMSSLCKYATSIYWLKASFFFLVFIALVVGLSFGLKRKDENADLPSVYMGTGDPFFQSLLPTKMPSARPNVSRSPTLMPVGGESSIVATFFFPTPVPDESFSAMPLANYSASPSTVPLSSSGQMTSSPNTMAPAEAIIQTNDPTQGLLVASDTSINPTSPEIYPLIGPIDESGMRMILYGVSSLTDMGRIQYTMLTAAYVEQFYNTDQKGEDGVQNIVYDVVATIVIDSEELLGAGGSGNGRRELQGDGAADGLIVTFTLTLRYHTFSATIDVNTIANRPFFNEAMRHDYVDFLIANGAASLFISSVSPIFYGDDIPDTTPVTTALMPSHSPTLLILATASPTIFLKAQGTDYVPTPGPLVAETTPEPSSDLATPEPSVVEATPEPSSYLATPGPLVAETTPEPSSYLATPEPSVVEAMPEPSSYLATLGPLVAETTPEPSTLEPCPSTTMPIVAMNPTTSAPSTTMKPSCMPSDDGSTPDESLFLPTTTPTYSPIDIIIPEKAD